MAQLVDLYKAQQSQLGTDKISKAAGEPRKTPLSTDEFMHILKQYGLPFGKPDLFDIVKKEPLKNIIANINDEKVTFVGDEQLDVDADQSKSDKVVDQMAKKAMK